MRMNFNSVKMPAKYQILGYAIIAYVILALWMFLKPKEAIKTPFYLIKEYR